MLIKEIYFYLITLLTFFLIKEIDSVELYQISILIYYIYILIKSYNIDRSNIFMFLFLHSLFIFMYGRTVLLPLIFKIHLNSDWFLHLNYSTKDYIYIYQMLLLNLLGIDLGIKIWKSYLELKKRDMKIAEQ